MKRFLTSKAGNITLGLVLFIAIFAFMQLVIGIGGAIGGAIAGAIGFGIAGVIKGALTKGDKEAQEEEK